MQKKISFIIPAYNASYTILQTLESIYALPLSHDDFEVIVVDDCSTDDTRDVLAVYQQTHSNLVVLHQPINQRQGAARNRGVDDAHGEYVLFVDSDDMVGCGVCDALNCALKNSLDVCFFTTCIHFPNNETFDNRFHLADGEICDGKDFLSKYFDYSLNAPYRGIIKHSLLQETNIRFIEGIQWEDGDWCLDLYHKAKRVLEVTDCGYHYMVRPGSTTQVPSIQAMRDQLKLGIRLIAYSETNFCEQDKIYDKTIIEAQNRYIQHVLRPGNLIQYNWEELRRLHCSLTQEEWKVVAQWAPTLWGRWVSEHNIFVRLLLQIARPVKGILKTMHYRIKHR